MLIKRKQWLWVFFLVLVIALAYFGYALTPKADILMENDYNNIGNMYIYPDIVQDGEYIYFIGFDTPNLCKADKDDLNLRNVENYGGNIEKLFLPSNGVLYFVNGDDSGSVYSIDKDGKNKTKLTDMTCDELITFQEKIYFTSTDGLYSMDLDGSNLEMVYPEPVTNIFAYESYLYFIRTYKNVRSRDIIIDRRRVVRLCPSDHKITVLGGDGVRRFLVLNDRIYYLDENILYNMDLDGLEKLEMPYYPLEDTMNVYGKYLVFSSHYQNLGTFAIDTQTGEEKKVSTDIYQYISVINNAFFTNKKYLPLKRRIFE